MSKFTPRSDQKEILYYSGGMAAIPAVPGSGKTFSLTMLTSKIVREILEEKEKILIVTYMNSSVASLKQKISSVLNEYDLDYRKYVDIYTIHSLSSTILKENMEVSGVGEEYEIINSNSRENLINMTITEYRAKYPEKFSSIISDDKKNDEVILSNWHKTTGRLLQYFIGLYKCYGLELKKYDSSNELYSYLIELYNIYKRNVDKSGFLDYDDLIFKSFNILSTYREISKKYENRYKFVIEDEAQDSNYLQWEILKKIAGKNENIIRFGDSNQSIMGTFTPSSPKLFLDFIKNAKNIYPLNKAGRSSEEIINIANKFVKWTRENHPEDNCKRSLVDKMICPTDANELPKNPKPDKFGINIFESNSKKSEHEKILKAVKNFKKLYPDKTIAILCPDRKTIGDLAKFFTEDNLQFEKLNESDTDSELLLELIGDILDYVSNPNSVPNLINLISNPRFGLKESKHSFFKAFRGKKLEDVFINEVEVEILSKELMEKIYKIINFPKFSVEKLIMFISEVLEFNMKEKNIIISICSEINKLKKINPRPSLKLLAQELKNPYSGFGYFSKFIYNINGYSSIAGVPTISTYHKSKGLEWDLVFLTGISKRSFQATTNETLKNEYNYLREGFRNPNSVIKGEIERQIYGFDDISYEHYFKIEEISERVRLLYVGITRAKEYLIIMNNKENGENSVYFDILKEIIKKDREEYEKSNT